MGLLSRRESESYIKSGRILINGETATLGQKMDPKKDQITIDNKLIPVKTPTKFYTLLHKPDKVLVSRSRENNYTNIYDLPELKKKLPALLSPVGRLDYRTEGLLLLSNDGDFVNRLMHPKYKVERQYQALVVGKISKDKLHEINQKGLTLDDGPVSLKIVRACSLSLGASSGTWFLVTVREGRNRLVRRVFESLNTKVVRLIRLSYGGLHLPEKLKPGKIMQVPSQEVKRLKKIVQLVDTNKQKSKTTKSTST